MIQLLSNITLSWVSFYALVIIMIANTLAGVIQAYLQKEFDKSRFIEKTVEKLITLCLLLMGVMYNHISEVHSAGTILMVLHFNIQWKSYRKHFIEAKKIKTKKEKEEN